MAVKNKLDDYQILRHTGLMPSNIDESNPPPIRLGDLTEGAHLGVDEVAERLQISVSVLHTLLTEKRRGRGGRARSTRSEVLPLPAGKLTSALVWDAAEIDAIAEQFSNSKRPPGPKPESER